MVVMRGEITKGDSNIVVAVLDTGVEPNHVELPRVLDGYDAMTGGKANVYYKVDANHSKCIKYHGTIVAGMIAAAQKREIYFRYFSQCDTFTHKS